MGKNGGKKMNKCKYEITDGKYYKCSHPKNEEDKNVWSADSCGTYLSIRKCPYLRGGRRKNEE